MQVLRETAVRSVIRKNKFCCSAGTRIKAAITLWYLLGSKAPLNHLEFYSKHIYHYLSNLYSEGSYDSVGALKMLYFNQESLIMVQFV